jgi:hypothetical protein
VNEAAQELLEPRGRVLRGAASTGGEVGQLDGWGTEFDWESLRPGIGEWCLGRCLSANAKRYTDIPGRDKDLRGFPLGPDPRELARGR